MADSSSSSVSSFSSSSLLNKEDRHSSRKKKRRKKHHSRRRTRDGGDDTIIAPSTAAPSDYDELRAHYQFVLPTDNHNNQKKRTTTTTTWQQRMVQHYHTHLYKEYVLADLSKVYDNGKIGLRWRTSNEVANGIGFRCCGNLMCDYNKKRSTANNIAGDREEAYSAAVKRHMGIAVPENGGKEPLGVLLPTTTSTTTHSNSCPGGNIDDAGTLEGYLQSCAKEQREMMQRRQQDSDHDERRHHKKRKHSHKHKTKKHKRKHHKRYKHDTALSSEDDQQQHPSHTIVYILKEQECNEQNRLSSLPYGIGLHDYEVDFVYVEQRIKKRELVKIRLCLRCAPLLFVSKMNDDDDNRGKKRAPALKARDAREKAARAMKCNLNVE